ncbi:MAG: glycyl-radical enzyme activating protein [Spirochaetes bacterium]|nr:glycyl-radical enzyme activating protein [Spirochaetota bacterium]
MKSLILEIKGNSLDDGPGIRTVIFFKGCPLNCVWCHNPESKKAMVELSWDKKECIGCLSCAHVCPVQAIDSANTYFVNRHKCTLCFACVDVCPSGAMSRVGKEMTVDEIMHLIEKDKPFFDTSGGGVTLSGGEPLMNIAFASELLQQCKRNNIHTLIETSGYFNFDEFTSYILPYCDMLYFDLKLIDETEHKKYCGVSNKKILDNFKKIVELSNKTTIKFLPRIPLVPGITATQKNLVGIAQFLHECGVSTVELLRYNPLWPEKCAKVGSNGNIDAQLTQWMPHEEYERCKKIMSQVNVMA